MAFAFLSFYRKSTCDCSVLRCLNSMSVIPACDARIAFSVKPE